MRTTVNDINYNVNFWHFGKIIINKKEKLITKINELVIVKNIFKKNEGWMGNWMGKK